MTKDNLNCKSIKLILLLILNLLNNIINHILMEKCILHLFLINYQDKQIYIIENINLKMMIH